MPKISIIGAGDVLDDILSMECNAEMSAHYRWPQGWGKERG